MSTDRTIEHEIEVPGTPDEVWQAIASGPGITGWWVPTQVEEHVGGTVELDFGPGFGVQRGRVSVWDPPTRFVYEAPGGSGNALAYEWRVEARDGGTCVVRLVTSGFLSEAEWQAEFDATSEGWKLFLSNLRLFLMHFAGQRCAPLQVQQLTEHTPADAWRALTTSLGLPDAPTLGQQVSATHGPPLAGRVERFQSGLLTLLLDAPARGVGFIGTESFGDKAIPMLYLYLFGPGADEAIARDGPRWREWMEHTFSATATGTGTGAAVMT